MTKNDVIDLVRDAGYGFLSTIDGDNPRVRPVMPYFSEEHNQILVAIAPGKRSLEQIKSNANVEFCFVDRKMSFCRISGKSTISEEMEKKDLIWENVPMLRQFFSSPSDANMTLLVVDICQVEIMTVEHSSPEIVSFG